tara:strand:+ start:109 stop:462 length:354 start_codon:yes stop_codon:yes gene_type:complete
MGNTFKKIKDDVLGIDDTKMFGVSKKKIAKFADDALGINPPKQASSGNVASGTQGAGKKPPAGTVEDPLPQAPPPLPDPVKGEVKTALKEYLRKRKQLQRGRKSTILAARSKPRSEY